VDSKNHSVDSKSERVDSRVRNGAGGIQCLGFQQQNSGHLTLCNIRRLLFND